MAGKVGMWRTHGEVGAALAAPTFGPEMGISNYVGMPDIIH